ncbi:MAG: CRISPR-associated helicase Cas3' [Chthoniobacterales bacterium]|nr:CRISPR-associated helicase Cas3' [Chthoniobacterales bacterium]
MSEFYAHTAPGNCSDWEPLFTAECAALAGGECEACQKLEPRHGHLNKVAWWTAKFSEAVFPAGSENAKAARDWGYLAGLWHDLGKFAPAWQVYLRSKADMNSAEMAGRVDHATAGAQYAVRDGHIVGHLLAYSIAGHHSGLLDAISPNACLQKRFEKDIADYANAPREILDRAIPELPPSIARDVRNPLVAALFTRLTFSALIDADFLATEAFMAPERRTLRPKLNAALLPQMLELLEQHIAAFPAPQNAVDRARAEVHASCRAAAEFAPGFFSLTVPTGGGKTLSSLAFALRHAIKHGQQRVIYVIPFTSIIDQNAAVFESVFKSLAGSDADPVVLQHHSNLSPEKETTRSRLAAENWDAPLIVTTAVQFYESLHAARTSSCRKLHHIANAVVIFDEAQCLPVEYLRPCLDVLRELTARYHTTAVLCTATQPAIGQSRDFPIGLDDVREIVPNPSQLYDTLRRVAVVDRGALDDYSLANELAAREQALVIVNTRRHAQALFRLLPESDSNFHLSALMCPAHRAEVLSTVRCRLDNDVPVRLISTQLIEAGVDIDFPCAYRALAGIDSIAQAAGRCNRNGRWPGSKLHLFRSEHQRAETYFRETAQIARQVLALHEDPLGLASVAQFFTLYYLQHNPPNGARWDAKQICDDYRLNQDRKLPFVFQYRTIAEKFRLIENEQVPVLIPFDETAKALLAQLRNEAIPLHRALLRGLQRYTVQIYRSEFAKNRVQFESVRDEQFHILICPETHYSARFGLHLDSDNDKPLIC